MGFVIKNTMIVLKSKPGVQESDVLGIGQLVYWLFKTSNIILVQQLTLPDYQSFTKNFVDLVSQCFVALLSCSIASNNFFWSSNYFILKSLVKLSRLGV
jgi:hypothetical protein